MELSDDERRLLTRMAASGSGKLAISGLAPEAMEEYADVAFVLEAVGLARACVHDADGAPDLVVIELTPAGWQVGGGRQ